MLCAYVSTLSVATEKSRVYPLDGHALKLNHVCSLLPPAATGVCASLSRLALKTRIPPMLPLLLMLLA